MSKEHDDCRISHSPCPKDGQSHDYKCERSTWDDETYTCSKCGHSYKIYEDDMK